MPARDTPRPSLPRTLETQLLGTGHVDLVAGVDEAGRGALAGPVVAAACALPMGVDIADVTDSKRMTPQRRAAAFAAITAPDSGVLWGVGVVGPERIDEVNILRATMEAMRAAIEDVVRRAPTAACYALVDGNRVPDGLPCPARSVVKGDGQEFAIGAASVVAKVTRDRILAAHHAEWPGYGFDRHSGYPTAAHLRALADRGPCPIHRRSFAPLK